MLNLQAFFETLVSMSLSASVVIVVVILVRFVFKKSPKIFQYGLWLFVLIRLVIPFSFESSVSVMNVPKSIVETVIEESPTIKEAIGVNPVIVVKNSQISMMEVLMVIWFLGVLVFLAYLIYQTLQIRKKIKFATKLSDYVYEHESITLPFVYGIRKPRIYLPVDLNDDAKKIVLAHEEVHIKRKDYIIKWVSVVLLMLHWFNPLVWP